MLVERDVDLTGYSWEGWHSKEQACKTM